MGAIEVAIPESEHFYAGESRPFSALIKQADGATPQDMTGWSLRWRIFASEQGAVVHTKTTGGAGTAAITMSNGDGTNDQANWKTASADTLSLAKGVYWQALERTDDPDGPVTLLTGPFVIDKLGV